MSISYINLTYLLLILWIKLISRYGYEMTYSWSKVEKKEKEKEVGVTVVTQRKSSAWGLGRLILIGRLAWKVGFSRANGPLFVWREKDAH